MIELLDVTEKLKEQLRIKDQSEIPVLVVEDDDNDMEFMRISLGSVGCIVFCAQNGSDAIREVQNHPGKFRIVFLDLKIPEPNGIKVFDFIQQHSPETEVVIVTGSGMTDRLPRTKKPLWVVQKPLTKTGAAKILANTR